jgi:hypothetical protein
MISPFAIQKFIYLPRQLEFGLLMAAPPIVFSMAAGPPNPLIPHPATDRRRRLID